MSYPVSIRKSQVKANPEFKALPSTSYLYIFTLKETWQQSFKYLFDDNCQLLQLLPIPKVHYDSPHN